MKIAIDLDGVLADFVGAYVETANSLWPNRMPPDYKPLDWDWKSADITKEEDDAIWKTIDNTERFWADLDLLPGVDDLLKFFRKRANESHEIFYVTSRKFGEGMGEPLLTQCSAWLDDLDLLRYNTSVITVAHGTQKGRIYDTVGIEMSIDDRDENVREAQRLAKKYGNGHQAFLLDQPWNRSAQDLDPVRLSPLQQFLEKVR